MSTDPAEGTMKRADREFIVTPQPADFTPPRNPLIARVATPFDDPDHPYGQWTVRLTEEGLVRLTSARFSERTTKSSFPLRSGRQAGLDSILLLPKYRMEFLVEEPISQVEKDMVLKLFCGLTYLASLLVLEFIEPLTTG
jgi:hypothetical protein